MSIDGDNKEQQQAPESSILIEKPKDNEHRMLESKSTDFASPSTEVIPHPLERKLP